MRRLSLPLVVFAIAAGAAWLAWQRWLDAPLQVPADGYLLELPPGTTVTGLTRRLEADRVLGQGWLLAWQARLSGQSRQLQAGEYLVEPGTTPRGLLAQLVAGRVRLHALTIVEGWTVRDLLAALRAHPAIRHTLRAEGPQALAAELGLERPHAEGLFFPDTYRFPRGTSDIELLGQAHELMQRRLAAAWARRAPGLPLRDPYEALILASIIERETALDSERPIIAGVFIRRLQRGMRLQTDPSVIYGLGSDFDGDLRRRDLRRDTPYNTYTRSGLPPTPIALPGEASLLAAVQPAPGDALYFVATGLPDGSHVFSATLAEHQAAVARYLRRLRSRQERN
ncbi:MAG: endolytic transglycosylase MltG [Gammaproteobacteria bacterium]|nr:MAG: endolytic transglycosylase MltG [Gammaproteobacteria bacterium]